MQGPPTSWYRQPADDSHEQDDRSDAPPPPPPHGGGPHAAFTPYRLTGNNYNPPYQPPQYAPYYPEAHHQLDLNPYGRLTQPHQLGRQDSAPDAGEDSYRTEAGVHQRHYSHPGAAPQMQYGGDPGEHDRRASYSHPPLFARQLPPPALEQPAPYHRSPYLPPEWNYGPVQQQQPMYSQQQQQHGNGNDLARVDSPREPTPPGHGHYSAAASVSSMDDHRPPLELQRSSGSRAVSASRRTSDGDGDERQAESADGNESEPPAAATPDAESDGKKSRKRRRLKGELPRDHALRKYKCEECEQKFARPSALATHILIHTKERPFVCITCEKSFAVMSNLRRHCRVRKHAIPPPAVRGSSNAAAAAAAAAAVPESSWVGSAGSHAP